MFLFHTAVVIRSLLSPLSDDPVTLFFSVIDTLSDRQIGCQQIGVVRIGRSASHGASSMLNSPFIMGCVGL